jgi:hypothetical protein
VRGRHRPDHDGDQRNERRFVGPNPVTCAASDPANFASVQFSQRGLALTPGQGSPGQVYRLMFWAKAEAPRTLHFDVTNTAADASVFSHFGDQTGNAWVDSVVLEGSSP